MGNIGWTDADQFQRIGFKHEPQEFLVRLGFKDNGFSIETVVQRDFIRRQRVNLRIAQDKAIVHITDVADKEVMVVEDGFEAVGPDLFTDGYHHEAKCW